MLVWRLGLLVRSCRVDPPRRPSLPQHLYRRSQEQRGDTAADDNVRPGRVEEEDHAGRDDDHESVRMAATELLHDYFGLELTTIQIEATPCEAAETPR